MTTYSVRRSIDAPTEGYTVEYRNAEQTFDLPIACAREKDVLPARG